MDRRVTDRSQLLELTSQTLAIFEAMHAGPQAESVPDELAPPDDAERHAVTYALAASLDWARAEEEAAPADGGIFESAGVVDDSPYMPSNQVLSLMQSAYDEYLERQGEAEAEVETPFDTHDPGWLSIAWEKLASILKGKHAFTNHTQPADFRIDLPENAVVALFSDWGTGEATAVRVMEQITAIGPTHVIHLGDVYYSGTPREAKKRFLDVIDQHGPSRTGCQYFALNANHDMYSGGYGYFDTILPALNQPASYFNLRNPYWNLIGIDSGYEEHGLQEPQKAWLQQQLGDGRKSILLSHHQLFSSYESRAYDRSLHKKIQSLLPQVYAWFWGHEHRCMIFGEHLNIRARCIGHGAIPTPVPYGAVKFQDVPVLAKNDRAGLGSTSEGIHGFAVLRFAGKSLEVSYIDEDGNEFLKEQLNP